MGEPTTFPETAARAFPLGVKSYDRILTLVYLAAHLHLWLLSACANKMKEKVQTLLEAMQNAYHGVCVSTGSKWTKSEGESSVRWIREAWILHGRELINNAAEREWKGSVPLSQGPGEWSQCPVRRRMTKIGSWYVEVAGKSEEEMLARWKEVEGERVLRGLYFG